MSTETNQPQDKRNSDFGLPQAEFRPIPERRGRGLRTAAILLIIVLIIGAGMAYWFFHYAPTSSHEEAYLNTNDIPTAGEDFIEDGELTPSPTPGEAKQDGEAQHILNKNVEAQESKNALAPDLPKKPQKGTITRLSTPQGCYYIVAGSFIDEDLASDYAKKLVKDGVDITILAPKQGEYFFRVAVAQADTLHEAHEEVEELKATYKNDIWVKKY